MRFLRGIRNILWSGLLLGVDTIAMSVGRICSNHDGPPSLAVVRLDAIGDFFLWARAASTLRRHYMSHKATLIASDVWAHIAEEAGIVDDVWAVDVWRLGRDVVYRSKVIFRLSSAGFDIAVNPTHSRSFDTDDALVRATRAEVRIGSSGDLANQGRWRKALSDRMYTKLIDVPGPTESELVRHAMLLRGLGIEGAAPEVADFRSFAGTGEVSLPQSSAYFVVVPGAGWSGRQWPVERYAHLADYISSTHGLDGVVCGAPSEQGLAQGVLRMVRSPVFNVVGKTDLNGFLDIIRNAKIVIANETSAVHIAASLGTPCVCILGGGHFGRFSPYKLEWKSPGVLPVSVYHELDCFGCNWECIYDVPPGSPVACIQRISTQEVIKVVDEVLAGRTGRLAYAL